MILSLDVRRARKGDCLLVHYGTPADPGLILIDGGPGRVYAPQLKPRLDAIHAARGLTASQPLPVDLLMISHIDDDHINGILDLTAELVEAKDERRPLPVAVRRFWHNTFDDIIGNSPAELTAAVTARFGPASLRGEPDVEGLDPDAAMVLASVAQGIRLRDDVRKLGLPLNPDFDGGLVMAARGAKRIDMGSGLMLTVIGPMKPELIALQKEHDKFLKQRARKKARASLAAFTDASAPNLSSLVVLAEAGDRRILLTGDARGDKILAGLELVGLLKRHATMHVDVLKMPHHGSDRNIAPSFFKRITADHYVFSGDGEHGNPERATLEMLRRARGRAPYTIHLTYPVDAIDVERKEDWEKERAKEKKRKKKSARVKVRKRWSPARHSLTALFAKHPDLGDRVLVVEAGKPHLIETLEPLGF